MNPSGWADEQERTKKGGPSATGFHGRPQQAKPQKKKRERKAKCNIPTKGMYGPSNIVGFFEQRTTSELTNDGLSPPLGSRRRVCGGPRPPSIPRGTIDRSVDGSIESRHAIFDRSLDLAC